MRKNLFLLITAVLLLCLFCVACCGNGTAVIPEGGESGGSVQGKDGFAPSESGTNLSSGEEENNVASEEKFPVEAAYNCELGSISIRLPEDWSYTIEEYDPKTAGSEFSDPEFGIRFYPEKSHGGIAVEYWNYFGVCGTGLEETETTVNGMPARMGVYDNSPCWSFIVLTGEQEGYVILNESGAYGEQVDEILNTLVVSKTDETDKTAD